MTNTHNARLRCDNGPLIHYARRPKSKLTHGYAGGTTCNIQYYIGVAPPRRYYIGGRAHPHTLVHAIVVNEPVTCVVCAIGYDVWP